MYVFKIVFYSFVVAPPEHLFCILECPFSAGFAGGEERQVIHSLPSRTFSQWV